MSSSTTPDATIVDAITDEVGDGLRSIARYEERDYELLYLREDVEAIYSTDEIEKVFDNLVLEGLYADYAEELFHAGDLQCNVMGFEDAMMFHFVKNDSEGLFVTYNRETDVDFDSFIDTCYEHL